MRARGVATAAVLALVAGCSAQPGDGPATTDAAPSAEPTPVTMTVETATVPAPSFEGNLLGTATERDVYVLLPPSYAMSDTRYPVIYFLAGFQEQAGALRREAAGLAEQMVAEDGREFILVDLDGLNAMGGNFYTNSPVSGNAEDFVAEDLVSYIDATYRTIPEASARGLAGFSMGGAGTLTVGMNRPDVFGALYAVSPGLMVPDGGLEAMLADNGAWAPYGAAFSPDPTATARPFAHVLDPRTPLAEQDQQVVHDWECGFGCIDERIAAYLERPDQVAAIRVSYGTNDSYSWIPAGTQYFADAAKAAGLPVTLRVVQGGGHSIDRDFLTGDFLTFFTENLSAS
jgi:S-formylglutathione hydrolase FrmB